ncbi:hypothetical protein [Sulfurisphaera tokodaii]|uniref:Uncharacterized protein n=2 Tax=Sulfurisphaera tokodaii TaxID=111955 RepID=Q970J6_SULTO|nr:hypothetical protein [Sulfurisphaera tokodaii]BAB66677.1 hypothetical protein STK_15990 [Sulfurisphaera tokodaii str. 7]HII73502.1 hypothetical protein [Sulfurisphaera tokodaii]
MRKLLRIIILLALILPMIFLVSKETNGYSASTSTQNLRLVISTQWAYTTANGNQTSTADQVSVYFANGTTTVNGITILPVFVVNQGQVVASGCWYENDGGLGDSNGPTMIQYINITNSPPNTYIYNVSPINCWQYGLYATQTQQASFSLTITVTPIAGYSVSGTVTAGVSETFYVYRVEGETYRPPAANPNYVEEWKWAINDPNANPYAQAEWTWPTVTLIYTPTSNGLYPEYQLNFTVFTLGHFWDDCFPWSISQVGAGWTIVISP